ncbi:endoplasmic reticulum protein SC65 isoform X1 [Scleropages formosus]|uniref:Endoplasmic reticulum protein SC65 n=1 Tax=Scleropages formosus TaxID=113540 RepID=A0A8C9VKL5_SCLFO|nr:endoplasmic reticulum protein SC65 isoform X1 [Scleropages formosus]
MDREKGAQLLLLLGWLSSLAAPLDGQYEKYSFKSFPLSDITPLDSAYGYALEHYAAHSWKESLRFLELSLRLYRLLKDSESFCGQSCREREREPEPEPEVDVEGELRVLRHIVLRASCMKACKKKLPIFSVSYPSKEVLDAFEKREPYRYIQYAHYQLNNLEKAVSAAHTFLQKNPDEPFITKNMNYYKTLFDVEEYLINHEEQPYEGLFLKAVKLFNSGDFSSSIRDMEQAVSEYFKAFDLCLAGCEGSYELAEIKDFFPSLAAIFTDALRCKTNCEANLTPNVGGFFVEKFVATMYHYLQFAYYKLNDVQNAAPCAASYVLFDPDDKVMKRNIVYYDFYREQWGLRESHFQPRPEALRYFNQTTTQEEMLRFAENYLQTDDEGVVSPEETSAKPTDALDAEFEGLGDYEEGFIADWWQEPKAKGDTAEESN